VPVATSTTHVGTSASSSVAASAFALSTTASVALCTPIRRAEASAIRRCHRPGHAVGVAVDERDPVDRDPGLRRDEHRECGLVALAVRRRSREHGGRAVVVDLTGAHSPPPPPAVISTYVATPMPSRVESPLARRAAWSARSAS
jgi:hypothetical protein